MIASIAAGYGAEELGALVALAFVRGGRPASEDAEQRGGESDSADDRQLIAA